MLPFELPFENGPVEETVLVGTVHSGQLRLVKWYSVSYNEELEISRLVSSLPTQADLASGAVTADDYSSQYAAITVSLATLALKRLRPEQCDQETANLPLSLIRDLADFILGERRQWQEVSSPDPKKLTGPNTEPKSASKLPPFLPDSTPAGPTVSPEKNSATSPSGSSKQRS